jgi:uncharacterized protein YfdQ (DUF2303 family)
MDLKTRCIITDFKEKENFNIPKVCVEEWIKENLEDILQGRYRFGGTFETRDPMTYLENYKQMGEKL